MLENEMEEEQNVALDTKNIFGKTTSSEVKRKLKLFCNSIFCFFNINQISQTLGQIGILCCFLFFFQELPDIYLQLGELDITSQDEHVLDELDGMNYLFENKEE